ncbi:MAG: putative TIM-barrel fold metal-dependent hydrolase [Lacunisphaera sp.]|nr:putative TIM-barrel fold metal-dependent hydrolase [Lacunisphaera sp.]
MNRRDFNRILLTAPLLASLARVARAVSPGPAFPLIAVDTHAHLFRRDLALANVHRYAPDYDATLDQYLRLLDEHGLSHGVVIQPSFLGTDNSYLVSALRAAPHRLRGIAAIDPSVDEPALDSLAAAGVVGIRLNLIGLSIPDLRSAPWTRVLASLARRDWQVEVQREARDLPQILDPLLQAGLKVVVDHFGRPNPKLGVADPGFQYLLGLGRTRQVWVKLSGAYRNGANGEGAAFALAAAPRLLETYGPDRLLWGSDWPHTQFEKAVDYSSARAALDQWVPDASARAAILGETPAKLYGFSGTKPAAPGS